MICRYAYVIRLMMYRYARNSFVLVALLPHYWFENFHSSRTQAVTINGVLSDFLPVISGVI